MTYDEAVNWLLAHGPLDVGRTGAEARKRWGEILDAIGFRQLQQDYDAACAELAVKEELVPDLDRALRDRDTARALAGVFYENCIDLTAQLLDRDFAAMCVKQVDETWEARDWK